MAENGTRVTRRSLLHMSWVAAAIAAVASPFRHLPAWLRPKLRLQDLTAESFRPYEGRDLVFARPVADRSIFSPSVRLRLVKVAAHEHIARIESQDPAKYGKRSRESFSLLFELKGGEPLGEGLHRLVHGDFDGCQLFLSQISKPRPDGTLLYEAVFG
jgi:hypothetical protein